MKITRSLWFVPSATVLGAVLLALGLVESETQVGVRWHDVWPRLFGLGTDGARGMLTAIASAMITVAGVVFSVTIVALSLAASQYSPRVLRTFINDRPTQLVLGVFVGIYAYCLVVLRTIRGGDEGHFVPSLAVLAGLVLALIGIGFLIYFIHHLADSIQASSILARITVATLAAVEHLFPEDLGGPADEGETGMAQALQGPWTAVRSRSTGYIINVHDDGLLAFARQRGRVLRMHAGIGDFVIKGQPLASLGGTEVAAESDEKALAESYSFDAQRTIEQDVAFGIQQIVDISSKALSPSSNDASTALQCIDRVTEILVHLARRHMETPLRHEEGTLRVIARAPSFATLVDLAYRPLLDNAQAQRSVLLHLLWSVEAVAAATSDASRRSSIIGQAKRAGELALCNTYSLPEERDQIRSRLAALGVGH